MTRSGPVTGALLGMPVEGPTLLGQIRSIVVRQASRWGICNSSIRRFDSGRASNPFMSHDRGERRGPGRSATRARTPDTARPGAEAALLTTSSIAPDGSLKS